MSFSRTKTSFSSKYSKLLIKTLCSKMRLSCRKSKGLLTHSRLWANSTWSKARSSPFILLKKKGSCSPRVWSNLSRRFSLRSLNQFRTLSRSLASQARVLWIACGRLRPFKRNLEHTCRKDRLSFRNFRSTVLCLPKKFCQKLAMRWTKCAWRICPTRSKPNRQKLMSSQE